LLLFLQYHGAHMNVNVHTDSYVNKDCSGLNHRNCVASCTRLMLYSHLDNNDDDDDDKIMIIIIIIIVATIIAIYISLDIIKIIKRRGRHVYE
jgi:hypothetical protein